MCRSRAIVNKDFGHTDVAFQHARDGLVPIRGAGDHRNAAELLTVFGSLHLARGDDEAALDCHRQALHSAAQAVSPLPAVQAQVGQATAMHRLGRSAEAQALVRHVLGESRRYGYRLVEGRAWTVLARLEISAEAREAAFTVGRRSATAPGPVQPLAAGLNSLERERGGRTASGSATRERPAVCEQVFRELGRRVAGFLLAKAI